MAKQLVKTNLKQVNKDLTNLSNSIGIEVPKQAFYKLRNTMENQLPKFVKVTPVKTGKTVESMRIVSRTEKGKVTVRLIWGTPYAGEVNFSENKSQGFASKEYREEEKSIKDSAKRDSVEATKEVLRRKGYKVK